MSNTDTTVNPINAFRGHTQAMAFARKGGAALGALLYSIAKRKEEEGKGPIEMVLFLEQNYSDEEGHNIPQVGSKQGETGNKPYDRYTTEVTTADGKKKVPGSWFTDAVKTTDVWADLNQRREWLKQGEGEGVPADIIALSTSQRAMEKVRIDRFIANMRTGLTKGAMLMHQMDAVNNMNPARVKAKLPIYPEKAPDGKEVLVVRGNLIRITDPSGVTAEDEIVTVGSFLKYRPEVAAKDPDKGSITSLKATSSKGPKKSSAPAGTGTSYAVPTTLEQTLTLFNCLASGLDNGSDHGRKMEAQVLSACAKAGKEGDEAVVSIGGVATALDNVWTVIATRYNTIMAQRAAALNVKATGTNG